MQIRSTVRWLLLSTSVLTFSCGKEISVGENESRSEQDAGKHHGASSGGATSAVPDASTGGSNAAGASQTNAAGAPQTKPANGGSGGSTGTDSAGNGGAAVVPLGDAAVPVGSCGEGMAAAVDVVSDVWMLQPGEERINCVQKTATEDLDIIGLNLESPNAVSVKLSIASGDDAGPDGRVACDGASGSVVFSMGAPSKNDGNLDGSLMLPTGNAIHVARGQRLVLETDVVDTSAEPVSAVSLVQAVLADGAQGLSPQSLPVTLRTDCVSIQTLAESHWSEPPGSEAYLCTRKTLASSFAFSTIRVATSVGTHDYVVSVGPVTGPDGNTGCSASTPDQARLLVTSLDGNSGGFPAPGGAAHADAGEQVLLKLHLFNTSASSITGTTSVYVQ